MLDPASAYEKLTGTTMKRFQRMMSTSRLIDTIFDEMHEYYSSGTSQQHFRYVDTPLVEAIRNGYALELQEPTVIANPRCTGGVKFPAGPMQQCVPPQRRDGTAASGYSDYCDKQTMIMPAGKPLNQSVISRMNLVVDLDEPDEETLVERVLGVTGCKEKKTVQTMARIVHSISNIVGKT